MKKEMITYKNPKSPISEIFRTLRTNIQFMNINKKMKILHLTSTLPNEGKSWVAANLAITFAQTGKKVLLIDSDMRKGRQYAIFGVSPKPGLSNFLSQAEVDSNGRLSENIENYIQSTEVENLYVITAGNIPPNPSELLVSSQMIRLLEELKEMCDLVIIDGTPIEIVTDSIILSRLADSTVIVTAHKITKKDALDRAIKNIQNVGGTIAGVILNKVSISAKKYGERYYYYSQNKVLSGKNKKGFYKTVPFMKPNDKPVNSTTIELNSIQENNEEREKQKYLEQINREQNIREQKPETYEENKMEQTEEILKQINEYLEKRDK